MRIASVKEDIKTEDFGPYPIKNYQIVVPINIFNFKNTITDKNLYVLGESKIIIVFF